ncbi:MEDS domain-containing protein [Streptomyces sclerotialus]|uniref:MEDS domain-containing protein n=1 Tax=Streptomyces sclerotialus TaxID=1957 RepID=UPI0004CA5459
MTEHHGTTGRIVPVERLGPGDHSCMDVVDWKARWQVLAAFTRTGLARGEKVLLVLDPSDLNDGDALSCLDGGMGQVEDALASGQLVLARNTSVYVPDGRFSKERQLRTHGALIEEARKEGYPRLRGAGDMAWAPQAGVNDEEVVDYEISVAALFADAYFTGLCWYDRQQCSDQLVATMRRIHPLQVMERLGALEVTWIPDGARIAGSAELGSREEFTKALHEALVRRPDSGSCRYEFDLRDLAYMEAHCAWHLIDFAAGLPRNHKVVVRCGAMLEMTLRGLGSAAVPQLELHVADEEDSA